MSPGVTAIKPPGHKRGLVVDVKDVEKGPAPAGEKKKTWLKKFWDDDWK